MTTFLEKHGQNALIGAIFVSLLSLLGTIGNAAFTYYSTTAAQDRQVRLEQVSKFDSAGYSLLQAAGLFISAVNTGQRLDTARLKLRTVVAAQIQETETLRGTFDGRISRLIDNYQGALSEFNKDAAMTSSVTEMRPWAESFGRLLDARAALNRGLLKVLGLATHKGT